MKNWKLWQKAIEYFIPLTIIVSCYIAIALRFIIKKSKLGLINAVRSSSHCVLLAVSFVFTFSPVNIHKTLDWYQYLIDGKSSSLSFNYRVPNKFLLMKWGWIIKTYFRYKNYTTFVLYSHPTTTLLGYASYLLVSFDFLMISATPETPDKGLWNKGKSPLFVPKPKNGK